MRCRVLPLLLVAILFSTGGSAVAQGGPTHFVSDSIEYGWEWISQHIGGDLFLTGEGYTLHPSRVGFFSFTGGGGLGVEMRMRPVFIGFLAGVSSHEIRPHPSGPFFNTSFYGGTTIQKYRLEIGEIRGNTFMGDPLAPNVGYTTYFLGFGRRYGSAFFAEPEVKIMLPIVAGYYQYGPADYQTHVVTEHYGIRDLFFAFGLRIGIGFDGHK